MTRLTIMGLMATLGCASGGNVMPVANTERIVTTWGGHESFGKQHICTEYVTPAEKLDARKLAVGVPIGGDKSVTASYEASQSLAAIYTVTEIMQFGHAALYRLCEASGNQVLSDDQYRELFGSTLESVHGLIQLELRREQTSPENRLMVLLRDIARIDKERCGQQLDLNAESIDLDKKKADQRLKLFNDFQALKRASEVDYVEDPAPRPVPLLSERVELRGLVDEVKAVRAKEKRLEGKGEQPPKADAEKGKSKDASDAQAACSKKFKELAGTSKDICGMTEAVCE